MSFWEFKNKTEDTGELYLYGDISEISWWGDEVTPSNFKKDLDALGDIKNLDIFINSGGGDVFAGQAINNMLRRHSAQKTVYIDGIAASIASVIAMAGDLIVMPNNAMIMVHKAWLLTWGNADELRDMADTLEKVDDTIVSEYVRKSGQDKDKVAELMAAETWMTAKEALELGFIDEIEESKKIAASVRGNIVIVNGVKVDITNYKQMPLDFAEEDEPIKATDIDILEKQVKNHRRRI
jgi:ATP-dependent Clp protease protease subunit